MEVIFIGKEFYSASKTMMSTVYKIEAKGNLTRTDWGFITIALEQGESVHIRPATEKELEFFNREL